MAAQMFTSLANRPTQILLPGDLVCEREPEFLGTVLGSCVSLCLWDRTLRFGGMNHFVLPNRPGNGEFSNRFGDIAVPGLIAAMVALGSNPRHLEAKLFGGAYVLRSGSPEYAVGRRNVEVAIGELHRHRIPIVASRLSGTQGLVIRQCTACGDVWVRPVRSSSGLFPPPGDIYELPCFSEGIAAAMVLRCDNGLPVPIRSRGPAPRAGACDCCGTPAEPKQITPRPGYRR